MTPTDLAYSSGSIHSILRRCWPEILVVWLLGWGLVWVSVASSLPPTYRASNLIRVDPDVPAVCQYPGTVDPIEPYLEAQVKLITSPDVLTAAAANLKVAGLGRIARAADVVGELRRSLSVAIRPGTYLIEVAMVSTDAPETATIVNAVVDAFMAAKATQDCMACQEIKNLEGYQVDLKNQMDELERRWKRLAAREDIDIGANRGKQWGPTKGETITIEECRRVRQELNALELELARTQSWLTAAEEDGNKVASGKIPADERAWVDRQVARRFKIDPDVSKLVGEIQAAETKLEQSKRQANDPNDPTIKANQLELDILLRRYHFSWDEKSEALRERIEADGPLLDPEPEIKEAKAAIDKLLARRATLKAKYAKLDANPGGRGWPEVVEIDLVQDGRETLRSMGDAVARRIEQLRREARDEIRIRPVNLNGASVPTQPLRDYRGLILGLIPFIALFGVVGLFVGVVARSGSMVAKPKLEPIPEV